MEGAEVVVTVTEAVVEDMEAAVATKVVAATTTMAEAMVVDHKEREREREREEKRVLGERNDKDKNIILSSIFFFFIQNQNGHKLNQDHHSLNLSLIQCPKNVLEWKYMKKFHMHMLLGV